MKYIPYYLLAILIILWCITRQSVIEGYASFGSPFSRGENTNAVLYALTEAQNKIYHLGNPHPPPPKNQFCNKLTGKCEIYMGDPKDPDVPKLQTLADCNSSCKYRFSDTHTNVCGIANPNINTWNTFTNTTPDVVLPVPLGKCPKGCVPNANKKSINVDTTNFSCKPDIWYTGTYGDPASCKNDADCMWCAYSCDQGDGG